MDRANVVYVKGSDQRLRLGRVGDVADGGLVVDLLCPNRRCEFAPFGRIVLSGHVTRQDVTKLFEDPQQETIPMEILVPETPLGPWMWLEGEVLGGAPVAVQKAGGAVVQWIHPDSGELCTDMVPFSRLQVWWGASEQHLMRPPVRPGTFIKDSLQLDMTVPALSTKDREELVKRLNAKDPGKYSPVFAVDLLDGRLQYIYQRGYGERNSLPDGYTVLSVKESLERLQAILLSVTKDPRCETSATDDAMTFPAEVWQEVLADLDTVTQTKLRAVCTTWNRIMETPALRSTIIIRGDVGPFLCMSTVFHGLRPDTQRVILTHRGEGQWKLAGGVEHVLEMLAYVSKQRTGIRLRSMYLHRITLDCVYGFRYDAPGNKCEQVRSLKRSLAGWRRLPCETIHIAHGILVCTFSTSRFTGPPTVTQLEMGIRCVRFPRNKDIVGGFLEAVEAGLPEPDEEQLLRLRQWLNGGGKSQQTDVPFVGQVLCALQSADPRPAAHYRGKKWCRDGLQDLRLEKLSRITRHFLVQLCVWTARQGS
ncbi:uncharacterized protein LOC129598417 [Paramacrobiotus metropolitanus]|uniref:uncharacterized protein LOC129598417 n=1 Tax=Paramacrobiotus metropolitanus TaxID=2943436 RepID=UPI002445F363|nr:uncharacterized protein LOC129598417 [Paramacrobiotus metropolitanus]